jgi:hypothetical protein
MKRVIVLFAAISLFQVLLFSQNKVIDLIITIDKEIVEGAYLDFIILDTINNMNDTVRGYYYPGHLSIKEADFDKIIKNQEVVFYFSIGHKMYPKELNTGYYHTYYHIKYYRKWFFTTYSLLHIYTSKTKEYRKWTRDNDSDKYTYEFYCPDGFMLMRARKVIRIFNIRIPL